MFDYKSFLESEDGAVTVDWVVLTAAIVGFGTIVVAVIASSSVHQANGVSAHIRNMDIGYPN